MLDSGLRAVLESWKRQLFRDIEALIDSRLRNFAGPIVKGGKMDAGQMTGTLPAAVQQTIDHGNLAGRADDDHSQYLDTARHDVTTRHGAAVLGSGEPNGTKFLRDDGTWQTVVTGTQDHDHSGDAGDGGTFDAANLTSGAATDGYVLTADGSGGAAWEEAAAGAAALDDLTDVDAATPDNNEVLTWDSAASKWIAQAPPSGGSVDADDVTYTPTTATDWDGDADPGSAMDALDQLAGRVDDLETGGGSITVAEVDGTPSVSATKIEFPNGTISDQGGGVARYTPEPGKSAGTLVQALAPATVADGGKVTLASGPSEGNILLAFAVSNQYALNSLTQQNVTWTRITATQYTTGDYVVASLWKGVVGASAGTEITADFAGNNQQAISVHEYSGATQIGPVASVAVPSITTASAAIAWFDGGGRAIALVQSRAGSPTVNPTAKWTTYASSPASVGTFGYMSVAYYDASAKASNLAAFASVSGNSNNVALILVQIAPV